MCDLFNKKLAEFVGELITIYPSVDDFKTFQMGLCASLMVDKKLPVQYFKTYVVEPYEGQIMAQDEKFFIQKKEYGEYSDFDIVSRLKAVWGVMDAENKVVIWKYMQVLVYLCKLFI